MLKCGISASVLDSGVLRSGLSGSLEMIHYVISTADILKSEALTGVDLVTRIATLQVYIQSLG